MEIENNSESNESNREQSRRSIEKVFQPDRQLESKNEEGGLDLGELLLIFRRRLPIIIGVTITTMALVYVWAKLSPKGYQAKFDLLVQSSTPESQLTSPSSQAAGSSNLTNPYSLKGDGTLLKVLVSPKLLEPIARSLRPKYPNISYDSLAGSLSLENSSNTDILTVTYQGTDPTEVEEVIRQVAQSYLKYSLESRQADIRQGTRFVDAQLPTLKARVDNLQSQLQRFRQTYNLSDPNTQSEQISTQINALQQQRYENQLALKEALASYADLKRQQSRQPSADTIASSALIENANYQKLRGQLLDLDSQIAKESSQLSNTNPQIQALKEQRALLLPLLEREAKQVLQETASKIRALEARKQALAQNGNLLDVSIKDMALRIRQYNDLQRELEIATQNLTQFLTKREALQIEAAQKEVPWELTTPPTQAIPILISTARIVVLGGLMGLLLGFGIALLYDKFKDVFYTPEDLKNETNLPLLGILPFNLGVSPRAHFYDDPFFTEACRSLYTNIRFSNINLPVRSLTISSVNPSDGKTTVSIHLALMAASQGQRVLLVDLDLRNPDLHHRMGLTNNQGLRDLVIDENCFDVIHEVPQAPNLFILTAGRIPADPLRVLSSERIKSLMAKFEANFDLVIYDTPPVLDLVDATVTATNTDGMALVVGLGNTKRSSFTKTLENLSLSPVKVIGLIANGSRGVERKPLSHMNFRLSILRMGRP
ncbi:MAG: polysaccharide biosynthesis tyrosine autokinase [Aphanocapsa sp. GSE-SYN-MK-11-07L]|jgi:capsular exopolysaccharide synthesis family protein|nr:polysaccharide biosynthesis tyrosine autokinase [Aphanocapsa sp. GSE-SYN-MK-11-07L]